MYSKLVRLPLYAIVVCTVFFLVCLTPEIIIHTNERTLNLNATVTSSCFLCTISLSYILLLFSSFFPSFYYFPFYFPMIDSKLSLSLSLSLLTAHPILPRVPRHILFETLHDMSIFLAALFHSTVHSCHQVRTTIIGRVTNGELPSLNNR